MSSSFFSDLDEPSESKNQSSFFSDLDQQPSRIRSLLSAFPKGAIKGAQDINPLASLSRAVPKELGLKLTKQFLPTQEKAPEEILEFAGEYAPAALLGEGGLAKKGVQSLAGGLAKKGAKEMNLPEWAQEVVGAAGMGIPDAAKSAFSKTLRPTTKQKPIVDFLRDKGFTEKEITPIIQDKKMLSWLSKGAMKYEEKDPWLKGIQNKLGDLYENIRLQGKSGKYLQGQDLQKFEDSFYKTLEKVPKRHRRLIEKEVEDLINSPIDFTELHDFNLAVNDVIKNATGGKASIGMLKKSTQEAQKDLNPSLFNELKTTDKAYSKLMNYTDKMTSKDWKNLINLGQAGQALYGIMTLNPFVLKGVGLTALGRYGLKQILSNPRLQNIHAKIWDSFLKNKTSQALKLSEILEKEIENKQETNQSKK